MEVSRMWQNLASWLERGLKSPGRPQAAWVPALPYAVQRWRFICWVPGWGFLPSWGLQEHLSPGKGSGEDRM